VGVHSGKFALVDDMDTVRNWTINEQQAPARGIASNTAFGPLRRVGVRSWNGTFTRYGGLPLLMPGDLFTFRGYGAPVDDVVGSDGMVYDGQAMVGSVGLAWDWQGAGLLVETYNFAGHLALSKDDSAAPFPDLVLPDPLESCGTKIQYSIGSGAYADFENLTAAQFTLNCALQAYVNSSTANWTGQKAGPIDWTLSLSQQDERRVAGVPDIGDDIRLKLFIDATRFWELLWGHVRDFTGIDANRETGAILARTINVDMTANTASGGALGSIDMPGATEWWPTDSR
jgi:hypothetical protein